MVKFSAKEPLGTSTHVRVQSLMPMYLCQGDFSRNLGPETRRTQTQPSIIIVVVVIVYRVGLQCTFLFACIVMPIVKFVAIDLFASSVGIILEEIQKKDSEKKIRGRQSSCGLKGIARNSKGKSHYN